MGWPPTPEPEPSAGDGLPPHARRCTPQSNFNAAIHGVGNSGLGGASIWGEHVFTTFSHAKHVVRPRDGALAGSIWGAGPYTGKGA